MSGKQRIFKPGVRKRIAYVTALRVFLSYLWLKLKSKILGSNYYDRKINALHLKNAERIKVKIEMLQGLFIKIGQLISNLSNVLPEEFRKPLADLQDHIKPKPYSEIAATIKSQLGDIPTNIFSNFDQEPLAAASIGQVHLAEINGQQVAVKIQHQHIDTIAKADLQILKNLVKLHAFFMNMQGLDHTYDQVKQMIEEELDYQREAKNMYRIAENLKTSPELRVRIPKVFNDFSTTKVLTSEYYSGIKVSNIEELKNWDIDLDNVTKRILELYCKMILIDGFYHADPHPGNILVNKKGEIILLDFGAIAHLNDSLKKAIPPLIEAVIRNDTEEIVLSLKAMGFVGSDKESKKYVKKLINIFKEFLENEVEMDGLNFQNIKLKSGLSSMTGILKKVDLREVSKSIKIPKDYIMLNRTIVLLIGNSFQLAPDLNTMDVIRPYIKNQVLKKENGFAQMIVTSLKKQVTTAISLPHELSSFLKESRESELEEDVSIIKLYIKKIYYLGQQLLLTLILAVLIFVYNPQQIQENWKNYIYWFFLVVTSYLLLRSFYRDYFTKRR